MPRWRLTPAARRDLSEIWLYTANRWGVDQADDYILQIEKDLTAAAGGSPLAQAFDELWRIRSGNHLCFYRKTAGPSIEVIRILHERMDIRPKLN